MRRLRRVIRPKPQADRRNGVFRLRHLRTLVIPGGVQRVGTLAFAKCSQMERVLLSRA